jgi:hypothetical protein
MNKGLKIILLVFVSALIVFLVDFFSGGEVTKDKAIPPSEVLVTQFEKKSEILAAGRWNKTSYDAILSELQMYIDQKAINTTDGIKSESYLQVCYAKSLLNSFEDWKKSKGATSITSLQAEINNINQIAACSAILEKPFETLKQYNLAIQLPTNIDNLLSQEYNKELCEKARTNILKICSSQGISNFPSIQNIKISQLTRVFDFEKFSKDYISTRNLWEGDRIGYSSAFMDYCPDGISDISKYAFYLNEFNKLDVCP